MGRTRYGHRRLEHSGDISVLVGSVSTSAN